MNIQTEKLNIIKKLLITERPSVIGQIKALLDEEGLEEASVGTISPALKGNPLTNKEFLNWIKEAESASSTSLSEAKNRWEQKRLTLQKLIK